MMQTHEKLAIEYRGIVLLALELEYSPAEPATLRDPGTDDDVQWRTLCIASDPQRTDITYLVSLAHRDCIVEQICEYFREQCEIRWCERPDDWTESSKT